MNKLIVIILIIIILFYRSNNLLKLQKSKMNLFKLSESKIINKIDNNVYVVDNFYANPDAIRAYALENKSNFKIHSALYITKFFNPFLYANSSGEIIKFFEKLSNQKICPKVWNSDLTKESNGFIQYITSKIVLEIYCY